MRLFRLAPLLLLPALFLSATCVTHVDQKGPAGPWVGEVTNTGSDLQLHIAVEGKIFDANGEFVGYVGERVCPFALEPGQKGYFSRRSVDAAKHPQFVQPLHMSLSRVFSASGYPVPSGISYEVLEEYPEHKAILVRARNNSPNTYHAFYVCALNVAPSGDVREVSQGSPFLGVNFQPGDVGDFVVPFDSSLDGTFEFSADSTSSLIDTTVKSPPFDYSTEVVRTDKGRELHVVGEVTNTSGHDLSFAWFQAYLESSPTVRINGFVGTTHPTGNSIVSGNGTVPSGGKALLAFILPLDAGDRTAVKIEGIAGSAMPNTFAPFTLSPVLVKNVVSESTGPDTVKISATLSNSSNDGLNVNSLCFFARDAHHDLLGGQCGFAPWIEPLSSAAVSQEVTLIGTGRVTSVEVVAYGHPGPKPRVLVPPT